MMRRAGPSLRATLSPSAVTLAVLVLVTLIKIAVAGLWEGTAEVRQSLTGAQAYLSGGDVLDRAVTAGNPSFLPAGHFGLAACCLLIAQATGLPFFWLIKIPAVLADLLIALLLQSLPRGGNRAALWYMLNPVTFLLSAYHGQPHTVAVACAVLSLWAMDDQRAWLSGLALGLAASVRQHFIVLAVPLWLAFTSSPRRFSLTLGCLLTVLLVNAPLLVSAAPGRLLAPAWTYGSWGYTMLLVQVPRVLAVFGVRSVLPASETVNAVVGAVAPYLYWGWALVFAAWVLRRSRAGGGDPWRSALLFLVGIYVLAPGFGIQWLIWALPFWLVVDRRQAVRYSLLAGAFLAGSYWQWSLNAAYGLHSITANLALLRRADLFGVIAVGAMGLITWAYCARAAWRLART